MLNRLNGICLKKSNDTGFTIIEIMIVIIIISILAAIAVPIYINVRTNATERTCQTNQRIIEGAVTMWIVKDPAHKIEDVTLGDLRP